MAKSITSFVQAVSRRLSNLRLVDKRKGFELLEESVLSRLIDQFEVDCVFDVGANKGQYATMLRKRARYKGDLISFEPLPLEFDILRRRARNDGDWHVENIAISDCDGISTFNIAYGSEFSSLSKPRDVIQQEFSGSAVTRKTIEVRTESLDTAFFRLQDKFGFKRPFLKLDTQGFDHEIITNGRSVINKFVGIQSELAVTPLYMHSVPYVEALNSYEELGFRPCAFFPNNAGHFPYLYEIDCVMLRADLL